MKQNLLQIVLMKVSHVQMVLVLLLAAPHTLVCLREVSPFQMWEALVEKVRTLNKDLLQQNLVLGTPF